MKILLASLICVILVCGVANAGEGLVKVQKVDRCIARVIWDYIDAEHQPVVNVQWKIRKDEPWGKNSESATGLNNIQFLVPCLTDLYVRLSITTDGMTTYSRVLCAQDDCM